MARYDTARYDSEISLYDVDDADRPEHKIKPGQRRTARGRLGKSDVDIR